MAQKCHVYANHDHLPAAIDCIPNMFHAIFPLKPNLLTQVSTEKGLAALALNIETALQISPIYSGHSWGSRSKITPETMDPFRLFIYSESYKILKCWQ